MVRVVIVVIINQCLKVPDFNLLVAILALYQRVKLHLGEGIHSACCVIFKELLDDLVALEFIRGYAKDLESLLLSDETSFDS
jgi:hypothetical protein